MDTERISVIAGGAVSIAVLIGMSWRSMRNAGRTADRVAQVPELANQVATMTADLAGVRAEMHPNSGSSLRDVVNTTRELVVRIDQRTEDTAQRLAEHIGRCSHG